MECCQVELATGEFPYKNCRNDFEMLAKILDEDPPLLPLGQGFSMDFCNFVCRWYADFSFVRYNMVSYYVIGTSTPLIIKGQSDLNSLHSNI